MELRFHLSGSVLYSTKSDSVPSVGAVVRIRTIGYKKGLHSGSIIDVPVSENDPPTYDYTEGSEPVVYINLNGYTVIEEGPEPPE